ncbi:hypothetical protein TWF281_005323 [Arthrobotrys megalospora]
MPVRGFESLSLGATSDRTANDDTKAKPCHLSKLASELHAQILSLLPFEDQLRASKAYPPFKDIFQWKTFKNERYTWCDELSTTNGKHNLFSLKDAYVECTARSGILETCLLKLGSSDYYVNAHTTIDPSPCLNDELFASFPVSEFVTVFDPIDGPIIVPWLDYDPHRRLTMLDINIWIHNESNKKTGYTYAYPTRLKGATMETRCEEFTLKQLFEGIADKVESCLAGDGLRQKACYGQQVEFQVFSVREYQSLVVNVHPVLDEIWPFPPKGVPSCGLPPIVMAAYPSPTSRPPSPPRAFDLDQDRFNHDTQQDIDREELWCEWDY